jgi:NAD(P)-dependent dehydrogenase (short-subunit alcohol dehydrogenase family)
VDERRVALVTGANRGIGLEICRQLGGQGLRVLLTSRREDKGRAACAELRAAGAEVSFHPLEVTSAESVAALREHVEREFGRLDALVNNAAVSLERGQHAVDVDMETVHQTLETNLIGPWRLCQTFLPLMRRAGYGRIVNVSSGVGSFSRLAAGYPSYRISKVGLNALTRILADELKETNILVNSVTPGWVRTHMGGAQAPRSVEEGAEAAVWLATLPDGGPTGKFFKDREEFPW